MRKYQHSKNSIFLLEIILDIIIFSFLVIIELKFFISTRTTTIETTLLHNAVNCCSNVATVYQAGNGSFDSMTNEFDHSVNLDNQLSIYFDKNYHECKSEKAKYHILVSPTSEDNSNLHTVMISFLTDDGKTVYEIEVCKYISNRPSHEEVTN